ncbi:T9SS type A sorting domain-containing protein [Brumimicrobium aurantiacum]|nr:T9SS type A sorting domain-containing protein [Brumimicrobium aurantiacum]
MRVFTIIFIFILSQSVNGQCDVSIAPTSPITCFGDSNGALTVSSRIETPLMITEVDLRNPDLLEIQNVTGAPFDATGYFVICSDSYTNINQVNLAAWNLNGVLPSGWIDYRHDDNALGGPKYWSRNMLLGENYPGWAAICDPSGDIIDIVFWHWTANDIASFDPSPVNNIINFNFDPASWTGDGINNGCISSSLVRSTNMESNDASDWTCSTNQNIGTSNISITPQSPSPISNITWNTGATSSTVQNLSAGWYSATVVLNSGCIAEDSIFLSEPPELNTIMDGTDLKCFEDSSGVVRTTPSGGLPNYSYLWSNGETTDSITNATAGWNSIIITDSLGCTISDSFQLTQPNPLISPLTGTDINCFGDSSGMVSTAVSGGTPFYNIIWSTGETTNTISNLPGGWYYIVATDANNCVNIDSIEIIEPSLLTINGTVFNETQGNDGSIDLTVIGGTPPYSFTWTNGAPSVEDPNGLSAGTYEVNVVDANGCDTSLTFEIESTVGLEDFDELQFSIAPNPNKGSFNIKMGAFQGVSTIEVMNALGQMIYQKTITGSNHKVELNQAKKGVYFIRVNNVKGSKVMKFIVE